MYRFKWGILLLLWSFLQGQDVLVEQVLDTKVKTIELSNISSGQAQPYILLNNDILGVSFDYMDANVVNFAYRIIHCNWDWTVSDLSYSEYSSGFKQMYIQDYQFSFNTLVDYVNYSFVLPNEDVPILLSGNYILEVFHENDENNIVFTKRFVVFENKLNVQGKIVKPNAVEDVPYMQKLNITINIDKAPVDQPFRNVKVAVIQNQNWKTIKQVDQASYINGFEMIFEQENKLKFEAINEFRYFDSRSINANNERSISNFNEKDTIHYILTLDPNKSYLNYINDQDINGGFVIATEAGNHPEIHSEYLKVHFTLGINRAISDGGFYIVGAFNNFETSERNQLYFDAENKVYRGTIWLKQGYYNYWIVFKDQKGEIHYETIEGSHSETENSYQIFTYYYDFDLGTERILSCKTIDTKDFR